MWNIDEKMAAIGKRWESSRAVLISSSWNIDEIMAAIGRAQRGCRTGARLMEREHVASAIETYRLATTVIVRRGLAIEGLMVVGTGGLMDTAQPAPYQITCLHLTVAMWTVGRYRRRHPTRGVLINGHIVRWMRARDEDSVGSADALRAIGWDCAGGIWNPSTTSSISAVTPRNKRARAGRRPAA